MLLDEAYRGSVWVAGELHRVRHTQRGHLYFELVEKGEGDSIVGKLDAVIWRTDHQRIHRLLRAHEAALREGQQIRCRAQIDFYPPMGRLQLVVRDVDPYFTLGRLARRRAETLAALQAAGLLERNAARPLPPAPLRLALVTAADSAAYHDVLSGLRESGYGFLVWHLAAAVQGPRAEAELAAAFARLAETAGDGRAAFRPDAVLLVRGGGARTDLAVFDSRVVAEAVARCPFPVLTGLGHETDQTVADRVAHTALKTPTRVAAFVAERVAVSEQTYRALRDAIAAAARQRLAAGRAALRGGERVAVTAQRRLQAAHGRLREAVRGVGVLARARLRQARREIADGSLRTERAAGRLLERARRRPPLLAERIAERAKGRLRRAAAVVDGHARLCAQLAPDRILARGFSVTRTMDGTIVRRAGQVAPGGRLQTELAEGRIESVVSPEEIG